MGDHLRLAVVGCGRWSNHMHLPALKKLRALEKVDFAAVCDLREEAAKTYASEIGATEVHTDLVRMLKACKPDGVVLLVQPDAAAGVLETAIACRIPFIVEKPPAPTGAVHRRLMELAGGLTHVVAYNRRHSPYVRQAREWMQGVVPQSVACQFSRYRRKDPFDATAIHGIDTALYLAASPLERMGVEAAPGGGVTNYFLGGWTVSGTRVDIHVTPNTASALEHYFVRATDRTVVFSFPQNSMYDIPGFVELHEKNKVAARKGPSDFGLEANDQPGLGGMLNEHRLFVRALRGEEKPYSTLATTLQTQLVRDALVDLAAKGGRQSTELVF